MGIASFLIGVMPTFATIGIWAPVLLVLLPQPVAELERPPTGRFVRTADREFSHTLT